VAEPGGAGQRGRRSPRVRRRRQRSAAGGVADHRAAAGHTDEVCRTRAFALGSRSVRSSCGAVAMSNSPATCTQPASRPPYGHEQSKAAPDPSCDGAPVRVGEWPLRWQGQTARATRGRDLQLNVHFPRRPPDLLMAESPPARTGNHQRSRHRRPWTWHPSSGQDAGRSTRGIAHSTSAARPGASTHRRTLPHPSTRGCVEYRRGRHHSYEHCMAALPLRLRTGGTPKRGRFATRDFGASSYVLIRRTAATCPAGSVGRGEVTWDALMIAVTAVPSQRPSSRAASTMIDATSRWPLTPRARRWRSRPPIIDALAAASRGGR
jgi:hypothetical protein